MTEHLWTAEEVAAQAGVDVSAIYQWVRRGYITHAGKRGHLKLFRLDDVLTCERDRKRQHRKRSGR